MLKIVISGSKGRMGQALFACALKRQNDFQVVGQVDIGDSLEAVIGQADVVVDFSSPGATLELAQSCAKTGKAMVIGTTGHALEVRSKISKLTSTIPIVWASNFSIGMNTLFWLTRKTAELLGPDYDLEVVEMHHRLKKDAPSGTAKTLVEILVKVRDRQFAKKVHPRQRSIGAYARHGRYGDTGARDCNQIGMHAIRGGDVVGDHTVIFAADGERVELTHKASSRETFANGALRAAQWVVEQKPGLYSMEQVLGLV